MTHHREAPNDNPAPLPKALSPMDPALPFAPPLTTPRIEAVLHRARRPERTFGVCLDFPSSVGGADALPDDVDLQIDKAIGCLVLKEHEQALQLLREAEAAAEGTVLDHPLSLCRCYSAMAEAHWQADQLDLAIGCASQALAVWDRASGEPGLRRLLCANEAYLRYLQGRQFAAEGRAAEATQAYARAEQTLPELAGERLAPWAPYLAAVFDSAITVHLAAGSPGRATVVLMMLGAFARRYKHPADTGLAWLRLADLRRAQGATRRAVACLRRASKVLDPQEDNPNRVWAYLSLSDGLEELGDMRGAYEALVQANDIEAAQLRRTVDSRVRMLGLDEPLNQSVRDTQTALAQAERLSAVGQLVAGVNHELIQPMSSVKLMAETALEMLEAGNTKELGHDLRAMNSLCEQLVELADKLAGFPAQAAGPAPQADVAQAVQEALAILQPRIARSSCEVVSKHLGCAPVSINKAQLVRVLINLLHNALDAMQDTPQRRIEIAAHADELHTSITVSDSGPGINPAVRARLFQPFHSTKPAGQGLGLGLALSRDELRQAGGDLSAMNSTHGAAFAIRLKTAGGADLPPKPLPPAQ